MNHGKMFLENGLSVLRLQKISMIRLNVCHTLKTYILKKNYIIW